MRHEQGRELHGEQQNPVICLVCSLCKAPGRLSWLLLLDIAFVSALHLSLHPVLRPRLSHRPSHRPSLRLHLRLFRPFQRQYSPGARTCRESPILWRSGHIIRNFPYRTSPSLSKYESRNLSESQQSITPSSSMLTLHHQELQRAVDFREMWLSPTFTCI
jgi:hypothetical protein